MAKKPIDTDSDKSSFLESFKKSSSKIEGVATSAPPPKFWLNTGNYALNKTISGSYRKGYGSGRCASIAGPSGSGKSFLLGNAIKCALDDKENNWGVLLVDSEGAIDEAYLDNIGADHRDNPNFIYRGVSNISQTVQVIQSFIRDYKDAKSEQPFLIGIDSLSQLNTDSEDEKYSKGEIGGDQGQHAKQIKTILTRFVNDIKGTNITLIAIKQVYQEQDKIAAYRNPWRFTPSHEFAFSQILITTRTLNKDETTKTFEGITLKAYAHKTRFTKPYQVCSIDVPYEEGIDPYSGLWEAALSVGILTKVTQQSFKFGDDTITKRDFNDIKDKLLEKLIENDSVSISIDPNNFQDDPHDDALNSKEIREKRITKGD